MTTHARLSPSSRHRWARCPGSVKASEGLPSSPPSLASIDGTRSHRLLEQCIKVDKPPVYYIDTLWSDGDGEYTIDRGRADRVAVAYDYVTKRRDEHRVEIHSEVRVDPTHLLGQSGMSGTVDIVVYCQATGVLEIIDYKDGIAPVDVVGNMQLELYAYGALAKDWPDVSALHTVRMTIIQPKLAIRGLPVITSYDVPIKDLMDRKHDVIAEAHATTLPDAPLVPGEVQCKYCPAKGGCSALADVSLTSVTGGQDIVDPLGILAEDSAQMSGDRLAEILTAAPLLRQLLESAEGEALWRMQAGHTVPGYKIVRGRGSRTWAHDADTMIPKLVRMGLPKSSLTKETLLTPNQIKTIKWVKRDGTEMQLTPRQIDLIEREYVTQSAGKPTVAPLSDLRQAITVDVSYLFTPSDCDDGHPVQQSRPGLPDWLS